MTRGEKTGRAVAQWAREHPRLYLLFLLAGALSLYAAVGYMAAENALHGSYKGVAVFAFMTAAYGLFGYYTAKSAIDRRRKSRRVGN